MEKKQKSFQQMFANFKREDFKSWTTFSRSSYFGWFLFLLMVIAVSLTLTFQVNYLPSNVKAGQIASKDLKADRDYEIYDAESTKRSKEEAANAILAHYTHRPDTLERLINKITLVFETLYQERKKQESSEEGKPFKSASFLIKELGIDFSEDELKLLSKSDLNNTFQLALLQKIQKNMSSYVLDAGSLPIEKIKSEQIRLQTFSIENKSKTEKLVSEIFIKPGFLKLDIEQLKTKLLAEYEKYKKKDTRQALIALLASKLVRANVSYNQALTETKQKQARDSVSVRNIKINVGEYIIRSGDIYTDLHIKKLEGIQSLKGEGAYLEKFLGTALFVSMLLLITYVFSYRFIRKFNPNREDLIFLGSTLILILLTVRFSVAISSTIKDLFPIDIPIQSVFYAIPVSGGAMMVRMLINSESSLIFAIIAAPLAALALGSDIAMPIYYLVSSIAASSAIAYADKRSRILKAGAITGIINAVSIFSIKIYSLSSATEAISFSDIYSTMTLGILGGLLSAIFLMIMSPIAELVFDYTSDITLLELGNNNHPLLREMIMKAPGTYHHSQLVAILSESAAREIGANPLLCRIGGYFHDIGKMTKAPYFIENQQDSKNKHDNLAPSMSALIICSHVKDGLELAKKYKLPKKVAAFIPEHQGTKLIRYFYNKAKELSDPDIQVVNEKDYRYQGPRPQTRESGILLLADGVEAAVRSLSEKTPKKIRDMVQKIINYSFTEAQLDECELTLKDLHQIAESFISVLLGIYHQRIEYPDEPENKKAPKIELLKTAKKKVELSAVTNFSKN